MIPISVIDILKYYGYPESTYLTISQDILLALIKRYYAEHS